jgi:hypothetical protein
MVSSVENELAVLIEFNYSVSKTETRFMFAGGQSHRFNPYITYIHTYIFFNKKLSNATLKTLQAAPVPVSLFANEYQTIF